MIDSQGVAESIFYNVWTYFICFTIVLFPDSPAPVNNKTLMSSLILFVQCDQFDFIFSLVQGFTTNQIINKEYNSYKKSDETWNVLYPSNIERKVKHHFENHFNSLCSFQSFC